jgi:hypothetical protein
VLGLAVVAVAGCHKAAKRSSFTTANPDADAIATARDIERGLMAEYDTKIAAASAATRPNLVVQRAIHATHLRALEAGTAGSPPPVASAGRRLKADLNASVGRLQQLALRARNGENAALFASIAASHEVSLR